MGGIKRWWKKLKAKERRLQTLKTIGKIKEKFYYWRCKSSTQIFILRKNKRGAERGEYNNVDINKKIKRDDKSSHNKA